MNGKNNSHEGMIQTAERKRIEEALYRQHQELRTILDSVPALIFYKDKENRMLRVNKAFAETMGLPISAIEEKTCFELWPNEAEGYWRDDWEVMRSGLPKRNIIEPMQTSKGTRWVQTEKIPYKDEVGKIAGIVGFSIDITDRKQTEEELGLLKRQIEFILGATNTGLDSIDSGFNLRYVDPEWAKIYGDFHGKKCFEYFAGRKNMCPACGIPEALKTGKKMVTEEVLPRENNRSIQVTTVPFQDEKGEWLVAEVNVDITERKKMEEKLQVTLRDLQNFRNLALDREERMIELKKEVNSLCQEFGRPAPYDLSFLK